MFTDRLQPYEDSETECELYGLKFKAVVKFDSDHGAPWDEECGHGPVSNWTNRDKKPGERVLCTDDRGRAKRYYDFQAAIETAKKEGWDAPPYGGTKGERAARAVEADFELLRRWCNDQWRYWGVIVSIWRDDECLVRHSASLWGIGVPDDRDADGYLTQIANELLDEAKDEAIGLIVPCVQI